MLTHADKPKAETFFLFFLKSQLTQHKVAALSYGWQQDLIYVSERQFALNTFQ